MCANIYVPNKQLFEQINHALEIHEVNGLNPFGLVAQVAAYNESEKWLDEIEKKVDYKAWLCGHWHTDKTVDRIHFLYDTFITDEVFHGKERSSNEAEKY